MKIVVVGAGYAGTIAANHLAKKLPDAELTVVNPRADFVERVRLHQQIAGTGSAATPLTSMLAETIHTVLGSVNKIGDGSLTLEDGASLDFDYLLLAVGSTVRAPAGGTVPVGTWEGAQQSRAALAELPGGSVVTVVGGGLTGIEVVSEVAEARPDLRVRIVGEKIGASLSPGAQDRVRAELTRMGGRHRRGPCRRHRHIRRRRQRHNRSALWRPCRLGSDVVGDRGRRSRSRSSQRTGRHRRGAGSGGRVPP